MEFIDTKLRNKSFFKVEPSRKYIMGSGHQENWFVVATKYEFGEFKTRKEARRLQNYLNEAVKVAITEFENNVEIE